MMHDFAVCVERFTLSGSSASILEEINRRQQWRATKADKQKMNPEGEGERVSRSESGGKFGMAHIYSVWGPSWCLPTQLLLC